MIEVIEVRNNLDDFIALPLHLHAKDPYFIPQLTRDMRMHLSGKNPFFGHAEAKFFLARKDGKPSGRIISFINEPHNLRHNERTGFFGFFESVDDVSVSAALFNRTEEYLKSKGMSSMRGPMNLSTNEECGFLIEGFGEPPKLMMPYNPPYYNDLCLESGMKKIKDLFAYIYTLQASLPEKVLRVAAIAEKRGISVRPLDMKNYLGEMQIFKNIYNSAWEKNWGFIPLTDEEVTYAAGRLKNIIVPEMTVIAEEDGVPVGFLGLIPDFNSVLKHMKGKLGPISLIKALYYSKKIKETRVMLLGVKKEFRNKGVEALMFREGFKPLKKGNYARVEFSWILEDNIPVQRTIEMIGGRLYKKYRIYEKALDSGENKKTDCSLS